MSPRVSGPRRASGTMIAFVCWMSVACDREAVTSTDHPSSAPATVAEPDTQTRAKVFVCDKVPSGGRRDCVANVYGCRRDTCFELEEVWCFPTKRQRPGKRVLLSSGCTPDEAECDAWEQRRRDHPDPSTGPCVLTKPDEYIDILEQIRGDDDFAHRRYN